MSETTLKLMADCKKQGRRSLVHFEVVVFKSDSLDDAFEKAVRQSSEMGCSSLERLVLVEVPTDKIARRVMPLEKFVFWTSETFWQPNYERWWKTFTQELDRHRRSRRGF